MTLTKGNFYLIREKDTRYIKKICVIEVTGTCYKLKTESEYEWWMLADDFYDTYKVVEDLGAHTAGIKILNEIYGKKSN